MGHSTELRKQWGESDEGSPILHVDMDAFFAAVEVRDNPELAGREVIVGGGGRGVVLSATYPARKYGVRSAMPVSRALQLCPRAILVPPRMDAYRSASKDVIALLQTVTPLVEQLSIDEAFLDVRSVRQLSGSPLQIASNLRHRIKRELALTASIGIAPNKFVAKLASTYAKPDGVVLVSEDQKVHFVQSLPVGALWGVGKQTEAQLARHGLTTVRAIADTPVEHLQALLGTARGTHLHQLSWAFDEREVVVEREEKSIGHERTFEAEIYTQDQVNRVLLELSHKVGQRLRASSLYAGVVAVKIRDGNFSTLARSKTMSVPTDTAHTIYQVSKALAEDVGIGEAGIRLLGVRAENLVSEGFAQEVLDLDTQDSSLATATKRGSDYRRVEGVLDALHQRFGADSATAASLIREKGSSQQNKDLS